VRYFTGNGLPNHPTGTFPIPASDPAYPYYAAIPIEGNAAELPISLYNFYIAVSANPVYSETPSCFNELTIAIATQTGATLHANIADANDPVAALPMDTCWGHPYEDQYHYHGYSWKCFSDQGDASQHSPIFGFALDGFGLFGPRGDPGVLLTNSDMDVCHGHSGKIDWDGILTDMYHYHLNNEYPYGPGCYRGTKIGVFSSQGEPTPPPSTTPVPGPVPLLGALALLRFSRRLRKRCRPQATRPE